MGKMILSDAQLCVWVDIETTGLDEETGLILETGVLITDLELKEVASYTSVVQWGRLDWGKYDPYVVAMHEANGLRAEYDGGLGKPPRQVQYEMVEFLVANQAGMLPMCGSNVANFDRRWLKSHMAEFEGLFHYRNVDVSTIKESCRMWNPEVYAKLPEAAGDHRALADCHDTVREIGFYRDNFLWTTR